MNGMLLRAARAVAQCNTGQVFDNAAVGESSSPTRRRPRLNLCVFGECGR